MVGEPILSEPMAFEDGHLILTDKPGIGVEWDEAACRRYTPAPGGG